MIFPSSTHSLTRDSGELATYSQEEVASGAKPIGQLHGCSVGGHISLSKLLCATCSASLSPVSSYPHKRWRHKKSGDNNNNHHYCYSQHSRSCRPNSRPAAREGPSDFRLALPFYSQLGFNFAVCLHSCHCSSAGIFSSLPTADNQLLTTAIGAPHNLLTGTSHKRLVVAVFV